METCAVVEEALKVDLFLTSAKLRCSVISLTMKLINLTESMLC
jgi:hypothetical protein